MTPNENITALAAPIEPQTGRPAGIVTIDQLAQLPDSERRNMWINSLVETDVARRNYAQDKALAADFAACGQFDDLAKLTSQQAVAFAMVKIQLGRSWGFTAADSMRYIYFTNGRPAVENDIVASKLQQAGYDWDAEFEYETVQVKGRPWQKCTACTLWLKKWDAEQRRFLPVKNRKGEDISEAFTLADAENAKVYEKGQVKPLSEKFNYLSWPREMFYWRAISRIRKFHAPHVLRGSRTFEERLDVLVEDPPPAIMPPVPDAEFVDPEVDAPAPPKPTLKDKILEQASFLEPPAPTQT